MTVIALYLVFGVAFPAVDRINRTQDVGGVRSDGPIHATPAGLIIGVNSEGSVFAVDPAVNSLTSLFGGVEGLMAADMADDGTACAVHRSGIAGLAMRCSDERAIELVRPDVPGSSTAQPPSRADIVADGHGGWFVADAGASAVIAIDHMGRQTVVATFEECDFAGAVAPVGLAIDDEDETAYVALGGHGATTIGAGVSQRCGPYMYLGDDDVIAVIPRGSIPIALTRLGPSGGGRLYWHPGGDAGSRVILDGFYEPRGATLLPDGRIAVSAAGSLWIYRADSLPGF